MKLTRTGAIVFAVLGAGLWSPLAPAQGAYESYLLRSAVSERYSTLRGALYLLAENAQALANCDELLEGMDAAIRLDKIKEGCRVSIGFEPNTSRIWIDLKPDRGGSIESECASDLPLRIQPIQCLPGCSGLGQKPAHCSGLEPLPKYIHGAAQAVLLSARGEISGDRARLLERDPLAATGVDFHEYEFMRKSLDIRLQILAARRETGREGLNTWARDVLSTPETHPEAFVVADRDQFFARELLGALRTNAIESRQCEWLDFSALSADWAIDSHYQSQMDSGLETDRRACTLCSAEVGSKQFESLLSSALTFNEQAASDLSRAIVYRCLTNEQQAAAAQRLDFALTQLTSPPALDDQQRRRLLELHAGDADKPDETDVEALTGWLGAHALKQRRDSLQLLFDHARLTDPDHTLPNTLLSYLKTGKQPWEQIDPLAPTTPAGLAPLITASAWWLLDPEAEGAQRIATLGRVWATERFGRPVFSGVDAKKIDVVRATDLLLELVGVTTYAPEFALATAEVADPLGHEQPGVKLATDIMRLLAWTIEGRQAEVMRLVARLRQQLPQLARQLDLPTEKLEAAGPALDLFELAVSGQVRPLLDRVLKPLVECTGLLAKERGSCETARLMMAGVAVENGLVDQATQLLAERPKEGEAEVLALVRAMHLQLVARLALLEGDLPTADTAYGLASALIDPKSTVAKFREVREALDLFGLRLDLALNREQQARTKLQRLDGAGADLPVPSQVAIKDELAVAGWQLDPGTKTLAAINGVQAIELRYLQRASRGGDEALVRTLLNLRATRRDRRMAVAVANPSAGSQLAWRESAWFKGIEERMAGPGRAADAKAWQPDSKTVQSQLPARTVVLDFAVYARTEFPSQRPGARHLLVSILTTSRAPQLVDLGSFDRIEAAVLELRAAIQQQDEATTARVAAGLAGSLFTPVRALLKDARVVVVVPDSTLHLLPFDVLREPAGWPTTRQLQVAASLFQALAEVPAGATAAGSESVQIMAAPDYGAPQPAEAAAKAAATLTFAPLPGAAAEGKALMQLWGKDQAQLWSGSAASETKLRALRAPRILHLATHGYARGATAVAVNGVGTRGLAVVAAPAQPPVLAGQALGGFGTAGNRVLSRLLESYDDPLLRVGIALSGANDPDGEAASNGILDGREITGLDLRGTELVVLSACETAVGESLDGNAVGSLQRAFHRAGAQWVLSTLWPIADDATAALMQVFHRELRAGSGPQAALVKAKQALQSSPQWRQPLFWAAFQLSGPLRASTR